MNDHRVMKREENPVLEEFFFEPIMKEEFHDCTSNLTSHIMCSYYQFSLNLMNSLECVPTVRQVCAKCVYFRPTFHKKLLLLKNLIFG